MVTATEMGSGIVRRAKLVLVAGFLTLALFAGAGIGTTPVSAQPVGPGIDGVSVACRGLQNRGQELIDEYGRVGRANPNDPRLDEILAELRSIGLDWQRIGCQAAFGSIALTVQPPPKHFRGDVGAFPVKGTFAVANG